MKSVTVHTEGWQRELLFFSALLLVSVYSFKAFVQRVSNKVLFTRNKKDRNRETERERERLLSLQVLWTVPLKFLE